MKLRQLALRRRLRSCGCVGRIENVRSSLTMSVLLFFPPSILQLQYDAASDDRGPEGVGEELAVYVARWGV